MTASWVRVIASDILDAMGAEAVGAEIGNFEGGDASVATELERKLDQFRTPSELVAFLSGWLGRGGARVILKSLGLHPTDPSVDALVEKWLAHRGVPVERPRSRPKRLVKVIREKLAQVAGHAEAYEAAKVIAPEIERLIRLLALYYLESFESPAEQVACVTRALEAGWYGPRPSSKKLPDDPVRALESLNVRELVLVLKALDHCVLEPYSEQMQEITRVVEVDEGNLLDSLVPARNVQLHGLSGAEGSRMFCRDAESLINSWERRQLVPRGAIVWRTVDTILGPRELLCSDESRQEVTIVGVRAAISPRASLLISPKPSSIELRGERLKPLPAGGAWATSWS
jgi:hypothetical protein